MVHYILQSWCWNSFQDWEADSLNDLKKQLCTRPCDLRDLDQTSGYQYSPGLTQALD